MKKTLYILCLTCILTSCASLFVAPNLEDTRIGEQNVMRVYLDGNNKILVNGHETALEELKDLVIIDEDELELEE